MRSVSSKMLDSMKDWPLFVEVQVPKDKPISVDIFSTFDGALTGGTTIKTVKMAKGRVNTLWFKAPEDSAVSSLSADKGDVLLGRVIWKKLEVRSNISALSKNRKWLTCFRARNQR